MNSTLFVSYLHLNPNSAQRQKGPKSLNKQQIQIQQYQSRGSHTFETQEPNSIQTHIYLKIPSISSSSKPKAKQKRRSDFGATKPIALSLHSQSQEFATRREGGTRATCSQPLQLSSAQIKIFGIVLLRFFFFFLVCKCVLILKIKLES